MSVGAPADDPTRTMVEVSMVDCDVHPCPAREDELLEYMDEPWRSRKSTLPLMSGRNLLLPPEGGRRLDSYPDQGPPGSDPALVERQLLHEAGIDLAIMIPAATRGLGSPLDPEHSAASASAINRWLADTWLGRYNHHQRYRASIFLPINNPAACVRELETWAGHPGFVQCTVPAYAPAPYGSDRFLPVWEAAARHHLPVAIHVNGTGDDPMLSPLGHPAHFVEWHSVGYPLAYSAHLVSLICEGVFERLPELRFVFVEGGFTWLGPVLWHLQKNLDRLSGEVTLRRPAADYVLEQVRFTSQPVEEPDDPRDLVPLFEMIGAERLLMLATDYPHWDYDDPLRALPRVPAAMRRRILSQNASELYGLPRYRPLAPPNS
ncbi:MAG TPA: amidohydrolase family protein [Candidatus Nitrosotalea sp.]|nr:amidohydrolase family protein [Candidatus Nitrosotalea sp.]